MNITFELCMIDKYKMRITDTTDPNEYLSKNALEQLNPYDFRYEDTCTLDIITYKNNILYNYINSHDSALNEVYYDIPKDGNYTVYHIIIPNEQWLLYISTDYLKNYKHVYFTLNGDVYKLNRQYHDGLEDFNFKLKSIDTLDTDDNWYYIKQNSNSPCLWSVSSLDRSKIELVNPNSRVAADYYKLWCFVKNEDRIDIYNRATKTKLVYNGLGTDPDFTGWQINKVNTSNFEEDSVFYLSRLESGRISIINTLDNKYITYTDEAIPSSYITCEEVSGMSYNSLYTDTIAKVTDLTELFNIEEASIVKTQQDTFAICYIHNCFLNICQNIYNKLLHRNCGYKNNEDTFNRDFLYMLINVIKYNLDLGYTEEAQRILDEFNICGNNICNNLLNSDYGCGCS